ncbi:MAG: hypothetical protein U0136_08420 [Bdellovibrionota bacterium]
MKSLSNLTKSRSVANNERGQGLAEYIIIVILVAIIVLVAVRLFGKSVFNQFGNATQQIDTLGGGTTTN